MVETREKLVASRSCVIKIGSALLTVAGEGINTAGIRDWVRQIADLRHRGIEVVVVTSGSIAAGMHCMGLSERPHALHDLQAMAAIGQMNLVQAYETAFQTHALHTAQVLLTHDDLADRQRYLNARSALRSLLALGVIPVVNENDTVATDEIRFGDNDTLAALVTNLIEADTLIILTDQAGLYDQDPRSVADARLINHGQAGDPALSELAGGSGVLGRGGMRTKLDAAAKAARSGAATVIASGLEPDILLQLFTGTMVGTYLTPAQSRLTARKQWLAGQMQARGSLVLDDGAVKVLQEAGRSLLPVGIKAVEGDFARGEIVSCRSQDGLEVARGLVNYSADEARRIMGQASDQIEALLGYVDEPEMIHRDNMVLL